jgi:hypothetical protein
LQTNLIATSPNCGSSWSAAGTGTYTGKNVIGNVTTWSWNNNSNPNYYTLSYDSSSGIWTFTFAYGSPTPSYTTTGFSIVNGNVSGSDTFTYNHSGSFFDGCQLHVVI